MPHGGGGEHGTAAAMRAGVVPLHALRALVDDVATPAERLRLLDVVMRDAVARDELALLLTVARAARAIEDAASD